jgi:hypothetical protein
MTQILKNILHVRFVPRIFVVLVISMLFLSPVILIDYAFLLFIAVSLALIFEYKNKSAYLLHNSNLYFTIYFVTRTCVALVCIIYFASPGADKSKIIAVPSRLVESPLLLTSIFLFLLIFYWQIISKGLVRYGEVIARFYLDALPGQQVGIDQEKRDGLLSTRDASKKRSSVLSKSIELGSLDAGLRLTIGNLFLLSILTVLFLVSISVSYVHSGRDVWNSSAMLMILSETASFGVLLCIDAIFFIVPFSLALNTIAENEPVSYDDRFSFSSIRGTLIAFFICMLAMQIIAGSVPWEAFGMLIVTFLLFKFVMKSPGTITLPYAWRYEKLSDSVAKVTQSAIKKNSTLIEISSDLVERECQHSSRSKSVWIKSFLEELYADARISSGFPVYIQINNMDSGAVKITYPNSRQKIFTFPLHRVLIDMPISALSVMCSELVSSSRDIFPYHSWISKNEYEGIERNAAFRSKEKSLGWIVKEIILTSSRLERKEALTAELLLEHLHESSITKKDGTRFLDLASEIGYQRILDTSRIIEQYGYDGFDVSGILHILTVCEDDTASSILKHYFDYLVVNSLSQIESKDGEIRAVMVSDKTSSLLNDIDTSLEEVEMYTTGYLGPLVDRISSIMSVLMDRGGYPLLVLIPDISLPWIDDFMAQVRLKNYPIVLLERSSFPSGLQFYPIARV